MFLALPAVETRRDAPRVVVLRSFGSKRSALCVPRLAESTEQHFPEMSVWSGREEEMENAFLPAV